MLIYIIIPILIKPCIIQKISNTLLSFLFFTKLLWTIHVIRLSNNGNAKIIRKMITLYIKSSELNPKFASLINAIILSANSSHNCPVKIGNERIIVITPYMIIHIETCSKIDWSFFASFFNNDFLFFNKDLYSFFKLI